MSLYFIAIEPQKELSIKIKKIQLDFVERFNAVKAYQHFPHITLLPPFHFEEEKELSHIFEKIKIPQQELKIELKDFGCFHHPKAPVIFIQPLESKELQNLHAEILKTELQKNVPIFHPHLTVAFRDLGYDLFTKAWEDYQHLSFNEIFISNTINLYKHDGKKWNILSARKFSSS